MPNINHNSTAAVLQACFSGVPMCSRVTLKANRAESHHNNGVNAPRLKRANKYPRHQVEAFGTHTVLCWWSFSLRAILVLLIFDFRLIFVKILAENWNALSLSLYLEFLLRTFTSVNLHPDVTQRCLMLLNSHLLLVLFAEVEPGG